MSFFPRTPVRRLRVVRACGLFVLAIGIGCLPLLTKLDEMGRAIWIAMVGGCIAAGLANFWLARRTPPNETVTHHAFVTATRGAASPFSASCCGGFRGDCLSVPFFRHCLRVAPARLGRNGAGVRIWWNFPYAFIYKHFGYWPTVISLPVLGVCCCAPSSGKKLCKLRTGKDMHRSPRSITHSSSGKVNRTDRRPRRAGRGWLQRPLWQ